MNKVLIDFSANRIYIYFLHLFDRTEIAFSELSKFNTSSSGQVQHYKRSRINCKLKTEEQIILFDVRYDSQGSTLVTLFNKFLRNHQ